MRVKTIANRRLDAVHFHRRLKHAVREMWKTERFAADADETLDMIVPRCDFGVANRPVDTDAVPKVGFEVEIAPAIDLTTPDDGFPTDLTRAKPIERLVRGSAVRIIGVVCPEDVTELVEAYRAALNRLARFDCAAVSKSAKPHVPRRHVFRVVALWVDVAAGLENQCAKAALAQLLCGPATGDSRADDYCVVVALNTAHFHRTCRA